VRIGLFGVGLPGSISNREQLAFLYAASGPQFEFFTEAQGTGTLRPLVLYTEGNTDQLKLATDGSVSMSGTFKSPNHIRSVATSTLNLSGGSAVTTGGNIVLYGGSHATQARDIALRSATTTKLFWDDSVGTWTISATTASTSTTTGALVVSGGAGIAGATYIGGDLVVTQPSTGFTLKKSGNPVASMNFYTYRTGSVGSALSLYHSMSNSLDTHTAMAAGDEMGATLFYGSDGVAWYNGAKIVADATETWVNATDGGTRLEIWTTPTNSQTLTLAATFGQDQSLTVVGNVLASAGVRIGADSGDNEIDDASQGSASTTLYIGNASINVTSDERVKTDIASWDGDASALLRTLPVKEFGYSSNEPLGGYDGRYVGFTAQDLHTVAPWAVNTQGDSGLPWAARYEFLNGLIVKAWQDHDSRITKLETENAALRALLN